MDPPPSLWSLQSPGASEPQPRPLEGPETPQEMEWSDLNSPGGAEGPAGLCPPAPSRLCSWSGNLGTALAGGSFSSPGVGRGPSRLSAALRCWQWVIKAFIPCLEARRHQGLLSKQEPSSGAGSVQRGGRDAKAAWKKVWASSSSPSSLNQACEFNPRSAACLRGAAGQGQTLLPHSWRCSSPPALPCLRIPAQRSHRSTG